MAKPRPRLLTPPPRRKRQGAALLLTLAVLAAHLAGLSATSAAPPAPLPAAAPRGTTTPALQLRVRVQAEAAAAAQPAMPVAPTPAARKTRQAVLPPPPGQPNQANPTLSPAPTTATPPWPVYAALPPPPATRYFRLQRGARQSPARLVWAPDVEGYQLSLMAEGGELDGLGAASRGHLGPTGLVPERHVERRRGRDQRATNFDLARAQLRGSGGGEAHPWPPGGQDRLSWLMQLSAVLEGDAGLGQAGARVLLPVAGSRGPAAAWAFTVRGPELLTLVDGRSATALALQRPAQHPYDLQVEIWLDPADHHLPLRLRLTAPPGDYESEWLSAPPP